MGYGTYTNMSTLQKDFIWDGIEIQQKVHEYNENEKIIRKFKTTS